MGAKPDSIPQPEQPIPEDAKNDNIPTIRIIPELDNPDDVPAIRVIPQENGRDQQKSQRQNVLNLVDKSKLKIPDKEISMAPTDRNINAPSIDNSYINSEYSGVPIRKADLSSKVYQKLKASNLDIKLVKKPVIVPQWQKATGFEGQQFKKKIIVPFELSCKIPPKDVVRGSQYFDQSQNHLDLPVDKKKQLIQNYKEGQVSQGQSNLRQLQKQIKVKGKGHSNSMINVKTSKIDFKDLRGTQMGKSLLENNKNQEFGNKTVKRFELTYTNQPKELIKNSNYLDESMNGCFPIQSTSSPDLLDFSTGYVGRRKALSMQTYLFDRKLHSKIEI